MKRAPLLSFKQGQVQEEERGSRPESERGERDGRRGGGLLIVQDLWVAFQLQSVAVNISSTVGM